ncbi:hypothetical protein FBBNIHIM_05810 [Pseudocitrobacter vendiensis]|uniref:Transcriptional regulator n=1 Tax=Pseudocitrobacter vendiensis TaxID=2488306 RepID=A0ABM9F6B8_9ENTR|nr:hypothetical protein FBBNIHIM_05810 [Pseudocitrobacter vendiensis]
MYWHFADNAFSEFCLKNTAGKQVSCLRKVNRFSGISPQNYAPVKQQERKARGQATLISA